MSEEEQVLLAFTISGVIGLVLITFTTCPIFAEIGVSIDTLGFLHTHMKFIVIVSMIHAA